MGSDRDQYADHLAEAARLACVALPHLPATIRHPERISTQDAARALVTTTATVLELEADCVEWERIEPAMVALYVAFQDYWAVQLGSADEHNNDPALPVELREWLNAFIELWQDAENREIEAQAFNEHAGLGLVPMGPTGDRRNG